MLAVFGALLPIFSLIVLGAILKRHAPLSGEAWKGLADLCYFVLYPALLVKTLSTANLGDVDITAYAGALISTILIMTCILLLLRPLLMHGLGVSGAAFTSVFQGVTRWHGFVALAVTGLLLGDEGLTYIAITIAIFVPLLNLINVVVLSVFSGREYRMKSVAMQVARNPFIAACALGIVINVTGFDLPKPVSNFFDILGGGGLGLGLLTVGAGLELTFDKRNSAVVAGGTLLRLLAMPALMYACATMFGLDGIARTAAVIACSVPTAASSYVLARQLGGDAPLMAGLITAQVLAATVSMPIVLWFAGG